LHFNLRRRHSKQLVIIRFLRLILGAAEDEDEEEAGAGLGLGLGFEDAVDVAVALCDGPEAGSLATTGELEGVAVLVPVWGGYSSLGSEGEARSCP
jgi:hypothetical protein